MSAVGQTFRTWIPFRLLSKGGPKDGRIPVRGIMSDEAPDLLGDVVVQSGMDLDYFRRHGWINDNHSKATTGVVGVPTRIYPATTTDERGHRYEATAFDGFLLDDEDGRRVAAKAKALEGTGRALGFSVEGDILEKYGNRIARSRVRNVSVTNCPVNPRATMALAKSFSAVASRFERALAAGNGLTLPGGGTVPEDLAPKLHFQTWDAAGDPFAALSDDIARSDRRSEPRLAFDVELPPPVFIRLPGDPFVSPAITLTTGHESRATGGTR